MSQYFLISSTYRNRLLYPNPGKFVVPFSSNNNVNLNVFNVFTTTNPTSGAFPTFNCCWTNFSAINNFETTIVGGTNVSPVVDFNVNSDLLGIDAKPEDDQFFYLNQPLEFCFDILKNFLFMIEIEDVKYTRLIKGYDPIKSQLVLENPIPVFSLENGPIPCKIIIPPADPKSAVTISGVFLGASTFTFFDFEFYIYNLNQNEIRKVESYSTEISRAILEEPFSDASPTDQYLITTKVRPTALGNIEQYPSGNFYFYFPETVRWFSKGNGWFVNDKLRFIRQGEENNPNEFFHTFKVTSTGPLGEILEFEIYDLGVQEFVLQQTYKLSRYDRFNETAHVAITSFSLAFQLVFNDRSLAQFQLVGNYFFPVIQSQQYKAINGKIALQPNNTIAPNGIFPGNSPIIREQLSYDLLDSQTTCGVTGIKRVFRLINGKVIIYTQNYTSLEKLALLSKYIDKAPSFVAGITNFLILPFFNEGVVPLNFTGTQLTQTQMSCYNISITNLILPNRILAVGDGLLTSSYPFVFVSITNESNPNGGSYNRFFSNNPFASKALFVCSISDVNNPESTSFIKISSDGAVQTVKFSPVDAIGIEISLPNGIPFQTEDTDYIVPQEPNPLLQVTLFLEVKKVA